jgi:RNA polymerase sigma factor (sigma-70 family)
MRMSEYSDSSNIEKLLVRLQNNDPSAGSELIVHTLDRLKKLSRKMLHNYPGIHSLEETDDILQRLVLKLQKTLAKVTPDSVAGYFALANQNLNWVLKELARSRYVRSRAYAMMGDEDGENKKQYWEAQDPNSGPASCAEWMDFYEKIEMLPHESKEVFELMWFQGLGQKQAARVLNVSLSTLIRRWVTAKLQLRHLLKDNFPEDGEK